MAASNPATACRECILEALISTQSCPNCRAPLPPASLVEGVPASEDGGIAETTSQAQATDNIKATSESKLLVLLNEVRGARSCSARHASVSPENLEA